MSIGKWLSELVKNKATDKTNNFLYIRLLASTMVVAGHSLGLSKEYTKEAMSHLTILGFPIHGLGVLIFFSLSGYLITASMCNSKSIIDFFSSRILRIFPALIACVMITALILGPTISTLSLAEYFSTPGTWSYILTNGSLSTTVFFLPGIEKSVNGSLWTIPIEGRLYIIIGVLGLLSIVKSRVAFIAAIATILYAISENLSTQIPGSKDNINIVMCFFIGAAFYILRSNILISPYIATALALLSYFLKGTMLGTPILFTTIAYVVLLFGYSKKIPKPKLISDFSYGIYLYAFVIQSTILHYIPDIAAVHLAIISIPLSWIAGAISWKFIEKPMLSLKRKYLELRAEKAMLGQ